MKKLAALLLTLMLLCGSVSLANEITDSSASKEANTTVTFTIEASESYIVTIPPSVTLTAAEGSATGDMTITVSAPRFNNHAKAIAVHLTKTQNTFKLVCGEESLPYTISQNGRTISVGDRVLLWAHENGGADVSAALNMTTSYSANQTAGSYTDILTFTVSVVDLP